MMLKKFNVLSSYALTTAVALFMALISGCDRREEVYPLEGHAYAKDPVFKAAVERQVERRDEIRRVLMVSRRELSKLVKSMNGDYAAATNTPRGAELAEAIRVGEELYQSNRNESVQLVRERIERARADSERIRRGEAKPIDISKKEEL